MERRSAVTICQYEVASKMQSPITVVRPISPKVTPTISTDQGLLSNAFLAQGTGTRRQGLVSQGQHSGERPGYREVTTQEHALEITERRREMLEAKKLDVCPLCQRTHYYDKVWDRVTPRFKNKLVSTRLNTCPEFKSMSEEERIRALTTQSCCLRCTTWGPCTCEE